jgi:hypothetical protein
MEVMILRMMNNLKAENDGVFHFRRVVLIRVRYRVCEQSER